MDSIYRLLAHVTFTVPETKFTGHHVAVGAEAMNYS